MIMMRVGWHLMRLELLHVISNVGRQQSTNFEWANFSNIYEEQKLKLLLEESPYFWSFITNISGLGKTNGDFSRM